MDGIMGSMEIGIAVVCLHTVRELAQADRQAGGGWLAGWLVSRCAGEWVCRWLCG